VRSADDELAALPALQLTADPVAVAQTNFVRDGREGGEAQQSGWQQGSQRGLSFFLLPAEDAARSLKPGLRRIV
jgi:hypothetical protein